MPVRSKGRVQTKRDTLVLQDGGWALVVVVGLVRLCDPESNAGGSLTTRRAIHAGKVKG
jgi:hypothetical protein